MEFSEEHLSLLRDALFYYRKGKKYPVVLIINKLCPFERKEPSKDVERDINEAIYLFMALQVKETDELRQKMFDLLNGVRGSLI